MVKASNDTTNENIGSIIDDEFGKIQDGRRQKSQCLYIEN